MPSVFYSTTVTGLSTIAGYKVYYPDTMIRPFSVSISAAVNSTNVVYSVEHTLDYTGSSAFVSSNATWFTSSGISGATSNAFTAYTYPVTALRLNSTAGSSTGTITWTIVQAG